MRLHPLLGYSKMHAGVDFGVPQGTPIRAAGSGVVEVAGRHGSFGIAVEIKHNNRYETLYAHMSKLAAGVRRGAKVNQGQIIGYVCSTGRSTGPHLHYEVRVNGVPENPRKFILETDEPDDTAQRGFKATGERGYKGAMGGGDD
jgi:murein DD-endopeptidase MepM/ murein hydrolase activator NlpD